MLNIALDVAVEEEFLVEDEEEDFRKKLVDLNSSHPPKKILSTKVKGIFK
jgi:hypothetical protein